VRGKEGFSRLGLASGAMGLVVADWADESEGQASCRFAPALVVVTVPCIS
jgi:hypothetical protein